MRWLTISSCQSFHIYIVLGFVITSSNRETFSWGTISLTNFGQFFFNINYSFIPGRYIVCTCKDPMWAIYLPEETCNELDNCTGIPKLDIILASPKFPVPLSMEENQIRDPSCLFSPSNSVNTNSFVKANWFCTMQFPKDVFWVKLITSHNKICFNPINVRWLCLDPMCVCVFYVLYMFVHC